MQRFNHDDYQILEKKSLRKGFLSLFSYRLKHKLFAGGWSQEFEREIMDRGHAVVVLPYDAERDELVLLEQFRIGALEQSDSPWLLEFVAGMIDNPDETAESVAHRELEEEAGLHAHQLDYALTYLSTPGGCSEKISIYLAHVDSSKAARHGGLASENEDILVHVLPRTEVVELLEQGKINNAASVIGLQWLQLHLADIRKQK
ncbi:ADP-ribose pyrophosphatase [Pseudidiomarina piscicola]|uniref:ADP-ribose pyrophosphatase n=1 Tax=Pseudidiomarina piscicola TaxID=2614830 RepID=A0A6S6WSQ2_9GAMM|nr:NUDIX domain-containing protein [Pseudidiomarina piscicola]CAB0151952.1 ADP-ribose pyrophosphatase [Pseudidiomarina piscicola]VZT41390.1 ADP-ribose pyrophosphatase [Pseudomonas aeruginosa]